VFFFGVLSNTLPYLFLVVLYAVGLGSWLLGKPGVTEDTVESVPASTISVAEESNLNPGGTVHFFSQEAGLHVDQAEQLLSRNINFPAMAIRHRRADVSPRFPGKHFTFRWFSRPPPVLS
jgi:hypothetical protein